MAKQSQGRYERRIVKLGEDLKALEGRIRTVEIEAAYAEQKAAKYKELGFTAYAEQLRAEAEYVYGNVLDHLQSKVNDIMGRMDELERSHKRPTIGQQLEIETRQMAYIGFV